MNGAKSPPPAPSMTR